MQSRFFEMDGKRFVIAFANGAGGRGPREQAELTLARLRDDLERAGSRFENLLRITVYMKGREVWDPVREVRQQVFGTKVRPQAPAPRRYRFLCLERTGLHYRKWATP